MMGLSSVDVVEELTRHMCGRCPHRADCVESGEEVHEQIIECISEVLKVDIGGYPSELPKTGSEQDPGDYGEDFNSDT